METDFSSGKADLQNCIIMIRLSKQTGNNDNCTVCYMSEQAALTFVWVCIALVRHVRLVICFSYSLFSFVVPYFDSVFHL